MENKIYIITKIDGEYAYLKDPLLPVAWQKYA